MLGYLVTRYDFELLEEGKDGGGGNGGKREDRGDGDGEWKEGEIVAEQDHGAEPRMNMTMTEKEKGYFTDIGDVRLPKETTRIRVRRRRRGGEESKADE